MKRKLITLLAVVAGVLGASAASADAYIHASVCQDRLHHAAWAGDLDADNDIHLFGAAHGYYFSHQGAAWHPGGRADVVDISEWYFIPGLNAEVRQWMSCKGSDIISTDRPSTPWGT